MAKNPVTSKAVARKASDLLRNPKSPADVRAVAAAALGGARPKKKSKKAKKR